MRWFGRGDRDYREELDSHIEMEVRENLERGMAPDAARQAALRTFGNALAVRERLQEARPLHLVGDPIAGHSIRRSTTGADSGSDGDHRADARPRHRRKRGDLQPGRGRSDAYAAGARSPFAGHRARAHAPGCAGLVLASGLRVAARSQPAVFRPGGKRQLASDTGFRRPQGTRRRGVRLRELLLDARRRAGRRTSHRSRRRAPNPARGGDQPCLLATCIRRKRRRTWQTTPL